MKEVVINMKLKESIRRILREESSELGNRSNIEKYISKETKRFINPNNISNNFYDVVVDIYNTDYGKVCHVTFLMKTPFGGIDSEYFNHIFRNIRVHITKLLPNMFDGGVTSSTSTIDNYLRTNWFYEMKK